MSQSEPGYQPNATSRPGAAQVTVDERLRAYLLGVYNYMASGVLLSGVVAYVIYGLSVTDNPLAAAQANGAAIAISNGLYLTSFGFALFRTPLMLVIALALPIFALVYVTTFGARLWAALRPAVATFLGATVISSVYAETAYRKTPTPIRAAAVVALSVALVAPSFSTPQCRS